MTPEPGAPLPWRLLRTGVGLPAGHELTVTGVVADPFVTVRYRITPALNAGQKLDWSVEGRDDLGNVYVDGGGAYGNDGAGATEGEVSVIPEPHPDATEITFGFSPAPDVEPDSDQAFAVVITLR